MGMNINRVDGDEQVKLLLQQIQFFNMHFHASENQPEQAAFHQLMRESKNRCQLWLLCVAEPNTIWLKQDVASPNQEWLLGGVGLPEEMACHIPQKVLQEHLDEEEISFWNIK